ncbi:pyridoxal phosphate-dependent decarboxylase family protein [Oerskovia flava]|uniref:pyridoxal phosphate-dependent decarboxylase family protein n=1 Tax=Oerskovia flava TaxID=2986422 RepID=UPI00223F8F49|nr:aminotransferase class V-fold PLP-dependent enzyme [Oerskovia sp. JB1-3-2]
MTHETTGPEGLPAVPVRTDGILERLDALRTADAPTHGGRVLSYVYDPDLAELDELAARAIRAVQPLNGLDPTTFTSVGVMERELVGFARDVLHGDDEVVGTVTTGGTESCLLAVKAAREAWRARGTGGTGGPRIVAPVTVHAAFHKAAQYLGLDLDLVPVDPVTGAVRAADVVARLGADVALVVVSAPSYPYGAIDPVAEVAASAADAAIPVHVDACIGGWVLPFWPDDVPPFDFRVRGVTSISADVHKYGYAPKGTSVLLVRGRDLQRGHFFATTAWPGYPVVNPTVLGSRSAGPLAAAWAVTQALGVPGYEALAARCAHATARLTATVAGITGLRLMGAPTGPLLAAAADTGRPPHEQVDPHVWADRVRGYGWVLQPQPASTQPDGTRLGRTTHLTVTPVTARIVDELCDDLVRAADEVRGEPAPDPADVVRALTGRMLPGAGTADVAAALASLDAAGAWAVLQHAGLGGTDAEPGVDVPAETAPLMALVDGLPGPAVERLLVELIARLVEPAGHRPGTPGRTVG